MPTNIEIKNSRHDHDVVVISDRREAGFKVRYVEVDDESRHSPTRKLTQEAIASMQLALEAHPSWSPPHVDKESGRVVTMNPVSASIYGSGNNISTTMDIWRGKYVPSALALFPIQRPLDTQLPNGEHIDSAAACFFMDALDSIGIRTRAKIMQSIVVDTFKDRTSVHWVSLASGAAVPVIDARVQLMKAGVAVDMTLVDIDEEALAFAETLANRAEFQPKLMRKNLFRNLAGLRRHDDMVPLVDEIEASSADMVDALGIFEYIDDQRAPAFLNKAYKMVNEGGLLVIANMLSNRQQLDFNQRGIGWPRIIPRSFEEIQQLIKDADIEPENVTFSTPEDGIYTVVEIRK